MFKGFLILLLSVFLLSACSKKDNTKIVSQLTDEEKDNKDSSYIRPIAANA